MREREQERKRRWELRDVVRKQLQLFNLHHHTLIIPLFHFCFTHVLPLQYSLVFVSPSFSFIQFFLLFAHCWSAATKCIPFKLWIKKQTKRKSSQGPSLIKHIQEKSKPSAFDTCLNLVFTALMSCSYITETRLHQYISIIILFSWPSLAAIVCWTATLSITHYKNKTRTKVAFACDIKLFHTTTLNL